MWSIQFLKDLLERAIKTAAQSALVIVGGNATDFWSLDGRAVLGAALGGLLLSVLTSLGSNALPFGSKGTASLTNAVEPAPLGIEDHPSN